MKNYESRHKRGYGTAWDKLRTGALSRDKYLCQECLRNGLVRKATDVDHIRPKKLGGVDELNNLQSLCKACHIDKTTEENGGRRIRRGCDINGVPIDANHHWR